MCLFSLSWYTCGFYTRCHAAGGPSGVPLLAVSGAGLLFGVAGGGLLRLFPQCLCAVFPAAGTLGFLGFSCSACLLGWLWFCPLCQGVPVAVLSAWFAGGVPLLPFPSLRWVYFCLYSHLWQLDGPGTWFFLCFALGPSFSLPVLAASSG